MKSQGFIERKDIMRIFFMGKHGGSHPNDNKDRTKDKAIEKANIPPFLIYPLSMHIGAPAEPVVGVGEKVCVGTLLAKAPGMVSANIHSSVSGIITAIEKRPTLNGMADCIVIENDGLDTMDVNLLQEEEKVTDPGVILERIRDAGVVGMGGAAFPAAVKLNPPKGSVIDTLIINGAECEPYSTSDHRVMLEYTEEIIKGIEIVSKLFPKLQKIYVAIEDNKKNAIEAMKAAGAHLKNFSVKPMKTMYPRGSEKNLIKLLTGREVRPGGLPAEVRCVLMNVSSVRASYHAVAFKKPLYERVVSVSGTPVKDPKNLLVRIGTPVESLLKDCGGFTDTPEKLLSGGPMMGRALTSPAVPIVKAMTAITALTEKEAKIGEESDCIRCAECIHVCPVNLQPILISEAYKQGDLEKARELGAMDCIECGNCSYICPSKIPLLQNIRDAKAAIRVLDEKKKEGA